MKTPEKQVSISAPKIEVAEIHIEGTAPYVQLAFSEKAQNVMRAKMEAGSQAKKKNAKTARNFDDDFQQALHRMDDEKGSFGIPASCFRNAMISACRLVGFKMTMAKLSVFVKPDGFSQLEQMPMIHITGEPKPHVMHCRNATGVADLRVRGMFWPWSALVRVEYDSDQFSVTDVSNLMHRVGVQVGIGEGRPDSRMSAGLGWGTFKLV